VFCAVKVVVWAVTSCPKGIAPTTWLRRAGCVEAPAPRRSRPRHGELQFFQQASKSLCESKVWDRHAPLCGEGADRRAPGRAHDWAADVHAGIVEDEILELDQLAFGPQRSAGLSKIVLAIRPSRTELLRRRSSSRAKASSAADSGPMSSAARPAPSAKAVGRWDRGGPGAPGVLGASRVPLRHRKTLSNQ